MYRIYFVVLHYQEIKETIDCVNTIINLRRDGDICINTIVVDNASPNNSGKQLEYRFRNAEHVSVIYNRSNLGFARGNNIGFRIAKAHGADFIILINNDTKIIDEYFAIKLIELYKKEKYGVLGPDIYSVSDRIHQNPMCGFKVSRSEIKKRILKAKFIKFINRIGLYNIISIFVDKNRVFKNDYQKPFVVNDSYEKILHGSCLIFSKEYIKLFDGLFENTFMYYEEHILAYICMNNSIKMFYSPELRIEHYRGISTGKNKQNKIDFKQSMTINSLSEFLKLIEK